MRGRLLFTSIRIRKNRNTPAYAGKTLRDAENVVNLEKHPRVCGEDSAAVASECNAARNTPAYAGKTCELVIKNDEE